MKTFFVLIISTIIAEAIWELVKNLFPPIKDEVWKYVNLAGALVAGLVVALVANLSVFDLLEFPLRWPIAGQILTGILISRGSNYIHDMVLKLKNIV